MRIDDFLRARIEEDERTSHHAINGDLDDLPFLICECGRRIYIGGDAHRVLAECQAKRAIIDMHPMRPRYVTDTSLCDPEPRETFAGHEIPTELRLLAAVYSGHPDYDEAWKP